MHIMNTRHTLILLIVPLMCACGSSSEKAPSPAESVPQTPVEVWKHPVKSLHTSWNSSKDNAKVLEYIDFASANSVKDVIVEGLAICENADQNALELNGYACKRGVNLIISYDKYDLWRWGNRAALPLLDSTVEASAKAAAEAEMLLWPCPEGKSWGIVRSAAETECNKIARLVTSPRDINVFEGSVADLSSSISFPFFRSVATEWENEVVLAGADSGFVAVARKAQGEGKWFAAAICGPEGQSFKTGTSFLENGHRYLATVYSDKDGRCSVSEVNIAAGDSIEVVMPAFGGFAVDFSDLTVREAAVCVVPQPSEMEFLDGEGATVCGGDGIFCDPAFGNLVGTWREFCATDTLPELAASSKKKAAIVISKVRNLADEAYTLDVAEGKVRIGAKTAKGAWWGLQTLLQLMSQTLSEGICAIPALSISDSPAFPYRAAHLDCSRHFFTVDEVKRYVDMMSLHKLNTLHWHLTDDQGWRIEIQKYPLLTTVGAWRRASQIGQDYWQEDGIPYGPYFYTQDEAREVVAYAAERGITVIPEIEMPGHAQAAIASYPYLGCKDGIDKVRSLWGSSSEGAVCPSKETTYEFFEDVLDEIMEIFPSEYIHIGGDEVNFSNWEECELCQQTMKENGFEREVQLHGRMVKRIEEYVLRQGRRVIGWDEILDGGVSQNAIIMSWRGMDGGVKAAKIGNDAVLCPARWCYYDRPQTPSDPVYQLVPYDYREMLSSRLAYEFAPTAGLTPEEASHIKGVQANVWTEYINDFPTVEWMFVPRISATAEVGWSPVKTEFDWFSARVCRALVPLYESRGYNYCR